MTALTGSPAEILLAVQLEQAGISFEREIAFAAPRRRWRADFGIGPKDRSIWAMHRILVEIDGGSFTFGRHVRGKGFEADCEKLNTANLLGYRVLRFTPAMVEDGRAIQVIRQALRLDVPA